MLFHNDDKTYYFGLMGLWISAEFTAGFLVACLPVLPKFSQSLEEKKLTAVFGSSWQSFLEVLKISARSKMGNRSDDSKSWNDSNRTQPAHNTVTSDGYKMTLVPDKLHARGIEPQEPLVQCPENRTREWGILRSIHIVTKSEPASGMV